MTHWHSMDSVPTDNIRVMFYVRGFGPVLGHYEGGTLYLHTLTGMKATPTHWTPLPPGPNADPDEIFRRQFEVDVCQAYHRMGSKIRNTVCLYDDQPGKITLQGYYAGDWVDALDEINIRRDERSVVANSCAYALGRKTDELLIDAMETAPTSQDSQDGATGLTKAKVLEAFEMLGALDVPDDGQRFAIIGWKQWSDLLGIEEFANADYVSDENLPWKGTHAKRWMGTLWMPHSGLTLRHDIRHCYWYHRSAFGHAASDFVSTSITWHGDRAAHFVNNCMEQGAALVDAERIVRLPCFEP